jgi:peptide subunit release factor 1 (eRF1)
MLEPLFEEVDQIGMMVVTGLQTECFYVKDDEITLIKRIRSRIPGKTCRGGQSQNRIQRLRDEFEGRYIQTVAEEARDIYEKKVTSLVILGPANKKNLVYDKLYAEVKKITKGVVTVEGSEKIEELAEITKRKIEEKKEDSVWIERFLDDVLLSKGKAVYGEKEIKKALQNAMLEIILMTKKPSSDLEKIAKAKGCEIVVCSNNEQIKCYGDIVGMRWFPLDFYT